jgi:hypothetical protein
MITIRTYFIHANWAYSTVICRKMLYFSRRTKPPLIFFILYKSTPTQVSQSVREVREANQIRKSQTDWRTIVATLPPLPLLLLPYLHAADYMDSRNSEKRLLASCDARLYFYMFIFPQKT